MLTKDLPITLSWNSCVQGSQVRLVVVEKCVEWVVVEKHSHKAPCLEDQGLNW